MEIYTKGYRRIRTFTFLTHSDCNKKSLFLPPCVGMVTTGDLACWGPTEEGRGWVLTSATARTSARHQPAPRHEPVTTLLLDIYPHIYLHIYYMYLPMVSTHKHIISAEDPWHCIVTLHYVAVMSPQPAANSVQNGETLKWIQPSIILLCCKDYL